MKDRSESARQMMQLLNGYMVTKSIYVVAELGIADRIAQGTTQVAALAKAVGANEDALHRVMRALAMVGIF
ncbi:MAG: methyltransferase family protein, partial [Polyangiaceae bacterium]